jgi:SAM-dependent methyltransferase
MDFAGTVEAAGATANLFNPGDRVFGMCPFRNNGAQAEYFCMRETGPIARMPSNLRFDQAVVCEGAYYARPTIEHFALRPGHRILIYGASGAIGTAALQLAKDRGAEVVAVVAGRHLGLARSLGADLAVDYTTDAFDQVGRSFDFVLDAVGKLGIRRWRRWLKPGGVFAATDRGPWSQNLLFLLWSKVTGNGWVVVPLPKRGSGPIRSGHRSQISSRRDRRCLSLRPDRREDGRGRHRRRHRKPGLRVRSRFMARRAVVSRMRWHFRFAGRAAQRGLGRIMVRRRERVALVVFLRRVNVGGNRTFRPSALN